MTAQGGARRRVLTLALAGAAFVAVAVTTTGGPVPMATEDGRGWSMRLPVRNRDLQPAEPGDDRMVREQVDSAAADTASALAQILGIVAIAALVFLLGRAILRALSRPPPGAEPVVASAPLAAPSGPPRELSDAVDDGLAALASGPVNDVVIACWVRLEEAAAAGGVRRQPSETSTELVVRMLARFDVPDEPVGCLLSLYRAARYSRHRLDEADRTAAIAALREVGAAMAVSA